MWKNSIWFKMSEWRFPLIFLYYKMIGISIHHQKQFRYISKHQTGTITAYKSSLVHAHLNVCVTSLWLAHWPLRLSADAHFHHYPILLSHWPGRLLPVLLSLPHLCSIPALSGQMLFAPPLILKENCMHIPSTNFISLLWKATLTE